MGGRASALGEKHGVHKNLPNGLLAVVAPIPNERKPKGHRSNFQGTKWLSFSGTSFSDCVFPETTGNPPFSIFPYYLENLCLRETSSKVWAPVEGQSISLPQNGRFGALWVSTRTKSKSEPRIQTVNWGTLHIYQLLKRVDMCLGGFKGKPGANLDNLFGPLVVDMRFSGHGSGPQFCVVLSSFRDSPSEFRVSLKVASKGEQKANQHLYTSAPPKRK